MTKEEALLSLNQDKLRELLWLRHGCPIAALYGDDGEMQCSKCGIDFKRMSVEQIEWGLTDPKIRYEQKLVSEAVARMTK